jgi:DNA-binding transcriptional MerR regulator
MSGWKWGRFYIKPPKPPGPRKSRAKPVEGFSGVDIERLARVTRRRLINWVKDGLVPAPIFRGRATRYSRAQLARILVVKKLRDDLVPIWQVKKNLAQMTEAQMEAFSELAKVLGEQPPPAPPPPAPPASVSTSVEVQGTAERWQRIVLTPGIELHARQTPELIEIANEIFKTAMTTMIERAKTRS